jgi:hypothetical protein
MPIDSSIYFQQQTPDIVGSVERGMRMSDMLKQRKAATQLEAENKSIQDVLRRNVATGENGQLTYSPNTLSELAAINPEKAFAYQDKFAAQEKAGHEAQSARWKQEAEKHGLIAQLLHPVKDQKSYESAVNQAISKNLIKPGEMPSAWDKDQTDRILGQSLTYLQKIEQQNKDRDFGQKQEETQVRRTEAQNKKTENVGKIATDLRKERTSLPTTKATAEVSAAYNKIQSAAKNPTAAGDISLIFSFMKMNDPGSTVREGEFATAQNAAGVPEMVRNAYNRAISGERLSEGQRTDFMTQAGGLYKAQLDVQKQVDSQFAELARRSGVDPNDVLLNFEANDPAVQKTIAGKGKGSGGSSGAWGLPSAQAADKPQVFKTNEIEWVD